MDHLKIKKSAILERNGFHYFPDTSHYREKDLALWLPILKGLGAQTLVLISPTTRAIPEFFISAVAREKINIIIDFNLPGNAEINASDLETLMNAYGKWGVVFALFNKDVNCKESWKDAQWVSSNPVQESWSKWMEFAKLACDTGIKPVLPTIVPGGDFWDLAFLEQLFKLAVSSNSGLVNSMIISALAWDWGHHLNWGSGGPEKWSHTKPYMTPEDSQDHKGFHIFEWYASIAQKTFGRIPPVLLLESGIASRKANGITINQPSDNGNNLINIFRLMAGENVYEPNEPNTLLDPVPFYVIANNFYLLSSENRDLAASCRWFLPDGTPNASAAAYIERRQNGESRSANERQILEAPSIKKRSFSIGRYILLPHDLYDKLPELQTRLSQYIARYKPEVGFSIRSAMEAAYILVVGENDNFSFCDLDMFIQNGSLVKTINFNDLESLSV